VGDLGHPTDVLDAAGVGEREDAFRPWRTLSPSSRGGVVAVVPFDLDQVRDRRFAGSRQTGSHRTRCCWPRVQPSPNQGHVDLLAEPDHHRAIDGRGPGDQVRRLLLVLPARLLAWANRNSSAGGPRAPGALTSPRPRWRTPRSGSGCGARTSRSWTGSSSPTGPTAVRATWLAPGRVQETVGWIHDACGVVV